MTNLNDLHHRAQMKLCHAAYGHAGCFYQPIVQRLRRVEYGSASTAERIELERDLQDILSASPSDLKTMAERGADRVGGMNPAAANYLSLHARMAVISSENRTSRPSGADVLAGLRRRGMTIERRGESDLAITPGHLLTESDRQAITAAKSGILDALGGGATVVI